MLARSTPQTVSPACQPLSVRIAGVAVVIEGLSLELRQRLCELLRPFVTACSDEYADVRFEVKRVPKHTGWIIVQNGEVRRSIQGAEKLLGYLEWCVVAQALEVTSTHAVFHAAALTCGDATVMLAAESGAGKTTLTTSLILRGWLPLADDISLVRLPTLEVQPFPRCFHTDDFTSSNITTPSLFERPGALTGYMRPHTWAPTPSRPTCIIRLERDTHSDSAAYPLTRAEAAGHLFAASIGNSARRASAVRVAVAVATSAQSCWHVNNNRLSETVGLLEQIAATASADVTG